MVKLFFEDMIHLTSGEKIIKYWWLWLVLLSIYAGYLLFLKWRDEK